VDGIAFASPAFLMPLGTAFSLGKYTLTMMGPRSWGRHGFTTSYLSPREKGWAQGPSQENKDQLFVA
jgi:hypothetical protein